MHKPNKITTFAAELLCFLRKKHNTLTMHDRQSFSKPDGWQTRPLNQSPLIVDLHATWQLLQPTYLNELPDLAYRDIPSVDAVEEGISSLLALIMSE